MSREKNKSFSLVHLWWFVALIFIIVAGVVFVSVYNTERIIGRAEQNQQYTTELFQLLHSKPEWKLATDSMGRAYIDSIKAIKPEYAQRMEHFLAEQTSRQLTEHSEILAKEASSLNNTLVVWAGLLTLMAVIFTFLGFMELRGRIASVDKKSSEMDDAIEKATETIDNKVEEIHDALEDISDRKEDIERMQRLLKALSKRLDDVAQESLLRLSEKESRILELHSEVKTNTLISTYYLYLQMALNKPSLSEKIDELEKLTDSIAKNTNLDDKNKKRILGECYFYMGLMFYDSADLKNALAAYTKSINIYPNAVTHNNRGSIYVKTRKLNKAVEDFGAAINLAPNAIYYSNRGNVYYELRKFALAIDDYSKALELMPQNAAYMVSRGDAYTCMNEVEKALNDYNEAILLDSENDTFYYKRGNLYQFLEKNNLALTDYLRAIKLNPYASEYFSARGNVYYLMNEYDMALSDYNHSIELDPEDATVYANRAVLYADINQPDAALLDYTKAIELEDDDPSYYTNRGNVFMQLGRKNEALQDYDNAIEIDPGFTKAFFNRGLLYSSINTVKAIQDFRTCAELDSDNKQGQRMKALAQIDKLNKNKDIL